MANLKKYKNKQSLNESKDNPNVGDRVKFRTDELKDKQGLISELVDMNSAIRKFKVKLDNGDVVDAESGDFINLENSSESSLNENKETLSKKDLADVLTINSMAGRKFSESDISDDVLKKFNDTWKNLYAKNPNFDPFGLDVELEDADVFDDFMNLIASLSKIDSKVSLFESKDVEQRRYVANSQILSKYMGNPSDKSMAIKMNESINKVRARLNDGARLLGNNIPPISKEKKNLPF